MLHADGINEKLRSQFVGTCLLALKNNLSYKDVKPSLDENGKKLQPNQIVIQGIQRILSGLLSRSQTLNKAGKLAILNNKVLEDQDVTALTYPELREVLKYIDDNVVPYINDKNTAGQDLLNLFFTTFNKYVGKSDKNQAFTPDHICDFMSKAVGVNRNSRVLDPCCGSGAFLVRAMTDAMDDCDTEQDRENVKKNQIYGIEYEEGAYGLSSTNMLIHGDGNSNVVKDSMFKIYLDTVAKFHRYSQRNIDLIYSQNPSASQVAGFKKWQNDFKRSVNKGEKGIRIAAPIIKKLTPEDQKRLDTTEEKAIVGYRYIPVFDISQTSGEPVLSAKDFVKENLADHKNVTNLYNELKNYLNNNTDIKVSEKRLSELGGAKGYFQPSTSEIVIGGDEPDNALKLKTLYHEYAHSQLHGLKSAFKDRPRAYQETQAEAIAYVAMQNIGVDTGNYSLGYVATWAKDKAVIHSALSEIQQVSNKVIELSDGLTKQLGLQEAQKEPEHDLKKLSAQDLNKSYQGLQLQVKQSTNPQQKSELKNQLTDVHQEISDRTQKQLQAFAKQNPKIKQPDPESDQSLKR